MLRKIVKRLKGNRAQKVDESVVSVEQRSTVSETLDTYTTAITFAESGLLDEAREIMKARETEPRKVLVVGHEDRFSKPVVDYALGFAERMGYAVVALNVLPLPKGSTALAPHCSLITEEFRSKCENSIKAFHDFCADRNIPFTHAAKVGEVEECIKQVHGEVRRIEFVISEPDMSTDVLTQGDRVVVPVYALAQ